ncbi:hypothetical protein Q8A67_019410 [Cirrhinus molitorella]|uniref:Ig-like domain-containing protein n=1 Tax=Cirrhinus molitorella TaxID=172907 RepID=A0AA88TDM0_9TELE|nr:hypothetical protein Q8A67_019410 [Cirrhinus molitorella]
MIRTLSIFFLICLSDISNTQDIHQNPKDLIKDPGQSEELHCSHSASYNVMLCSDSTGSFNMISVLAVVIASVFWQTGPVSSNKVHQVPTDLLLTVNDTLDLKCSHNITDYVTILWYQQLSGAPDLKLIGHVYYKNPTVEKEYTELFKVSGDGQKEAHLHSLKLRQAQDNGMYFCAARAQY